MTSLKTSIKTITYLSDTGCLEIQGASLATEEENSLLEAWKKYRVLLNRVDTSVAPDIEWLIQP